MLAGHREAAAVVPPAHVRRSTLVEEAGADIGAQHAPPHPRMHYGHGGRIQRGRGVKNHTCRGVVAGGLEYPIEDAAVRVHARVQGRAEAVDEDYRTKACRGAATGTVCAQTAFDHAQKDAQDNALHGRITVQEIAQALGHVR